MPQENLALPLAANVPGLKDYWESAAGFSIKADSAPVPVSLDLTQINQLDHLTVPQYVFTWKPVPDFPIELLDYTLVSFELSDGQPVREYPVKTVAAGEDLSAVTGSAQAGRKYAWEKIPAGVGCLVLNIKNTNGQITSSPVLAVDFSDPWHPETVQVDDSARFSGNWFPPRVKINGRQMAFDVPPAIMKGRILVPLRGIFEALSAQVGWEADTGTVTARRGETEISLQIGNPIAQVNGHQVELDAPPVIVRGRTLVPVRFVSESLGAQVNWNDKLKLAVISNP